MSDYSERLRPGRDARIAADLVALRQGEPPCGYKRNPRSARPPCVRPRGHEGTHSYDSIALDAPEVSAS